MNKIDVNSAAPRQGRPAVENTIQRLTDRMSRQEAQRKELIGTVRTLKAQRSDLQAELAGVQKQLESAQSELSQVRDQAAEEIEEARQSFNAQMSANQAYNTDLVNRVSALAKEIEGRDEEIQRLNKVVEDAEASVAEANEMKSKLNETIVSIQSDADRKVEAAEASAQDLSHKLSRHQRNLDRKLDAQKRQHQSDLNKERADAEEREAALKEELSRERARADDNEQQVEYERMENQRVCALMSSLQGQVEGYLESESDFEDFSFDELNITEAPSNGDEHTPSIMPPIDVRELKIPETKETYRVSSK